MLLAYVNNSDVDYGYFICDKFYILDTDDFIIQSISYDKLKSLIKEERVDIFNVWYTDEEDTLYTCEIYSLLDIHDSISSSDGTIVVVGDNGFRNTVTICGKKVNIEFVESNKDNADDENNIVGYKIRVNGVDLAYFYPSDFLDEYNSMDDIRENCFMGFDIVYKINSNTIALKYVIRMCEDSGNESSILLLFDTNGNFIDSYEYDASFFKRIETRNVSSLVAKLATLKKGIL